MEVVQEGRSYPAFCDIIATMSKFNDDEVRHLADMSGVRLDVEELQSLKQDIKNILDYVQQMDQLNTNNVEPTYWVGDLKNVYRDDEIIDYGVSGEELVKMSAESEDNQMKVPKVL